jgi:hypothetical protein
MSRGVYVRTRRGMPEDRQFWMCSNRRIFLALDCSTELVRNIRMKPPIKLRSTTTQSTRVATIAEAIKETEI